MTEVPRIVIAGARAAYFGPGLNLEPHHNAATTIAIALDVPFDIRLHSSTGDWSEWRSETVEAIPSGTHHHLLAHGAMAFFYLDPLSDDFPALCKSELVLGRKRLIKMTDYTISSALETLGVPSRKIEDKRIAEVVSLIEKAPQDFLTIEYASEIACLSPSRFRARFMKEVGVPFRRYRLWRRLAKVMHALSEGRSLTDAALLSGFSSSAHLSTAFKSTFGLSPNAISLMKMNIDFSEDKVLIDEVSHLCISQ